MQTQQMLKRIMMISLTGDSAPWTPLNWTLAGRKLLTAVTKEGKPETQLGFKGWAGALAPWFLLYSWILQPSFPAPRVAGLQFLSQPASLDRCKAGSCL